jgi:rhomboid protease GluP
MNETQINDEQENGTPYPPQPSNPPPRVQARFIFRAGNSFVAISIIIVTITIFILQLASDSLLGNDILFIYGGKINEFIQAGQYWRLITPVFLHGSITHLLFNMYALYVIGKGLELYYGHLEFTLLYFIAGIGGTLFSYFLTPNPALGASGAIFGLIAADAILLYKNKEILGPGAKSMLQRSIMIIVVNLVIGLSPGIDNWGHVGGMITGVVFAWFAGPMVFIERKPEEILIHLKSSLTRSIQVGSLTLLVFAGLILFKSFQ